MAVILLVASHVYGLTPGEGLRQPADTVWHHITNSIEPLRMPLFTVISGYVYALRPVSSLDGLRALAGGKTRRLIVPLIPLTAIVAALQYLSDSGGGVTAGDVARGYLFGYSHLWFLYAIFWVFLAVGSLDVLGVLDRIGTWAVAWGVGVLAYIAVPVSDDHDVLALGSALRLLPFFLLGYALKRHAERFTGRWTITVTVVLFTAAVTVEQAGLLTDTISATAGWRALGVVTGVCGLVLLFRIRRVFRSRLLGWIGTYAFTIYLLHTIANAGVKTTLRLAGVDELAMLFVAGFVAAVLLPVLFEVTFGRNRYVRILILGEKPLRTPQSVARPQSTSARPRD